jgi:DNA-binding NarL/FixJ family response regulator
MNLAEGTGKRRVAEVLDPSERTRDMLAEGTAQTPRKSAMKRLIVVADNSLIVETIRLSLRQSGGFHVLGYVDARATPARTVVEARPDVVLVDDMQHSSQAVEFLTEIRAEDENVSLILLTVRMDPEWLQEAFAAGASGAISKSIHPVALATLLRETVNGNVMHLFSHKRRDKRATLAECPLTARELEILRLVAAGTTNSEIARQLWVTEQTVKFHLSNTYRKLGVANRTEAAHHAHVNGFLEAEAASLI